MEIKDNSTTYLMGSSYFFGDYPDYKIKDVDKLIFVDSPKLFKNVMTMRNGQDDIFMWRRMTANDFIDYTLSKNNPLQLGKFLIPEICKEIGFTIQHLRQLEPIVERLDKLHEYQRVIYNAYLENNDFTLTDAQRDQAYEVYKSARKDKYDNTKK